MVARRRSGRRGSEERRDRCADGAYAIEGPGNGQFSFDHPAPDNLWVAAKLGLYDSREEGMIRAWAIGAQLGPKLPLANDAHGIGYEALLLVGRTWGESHLVLNLGGGPRRSDLTGASAGVEGASTSIFHSPAIRPLGDRESLPVILLAGCDGVERDGGVTCRERNASTFRGSARWAWAAIAPASSSACRRSSRLRAAIRETGSGGSGIPRARRPGRARRSRGRPASRARTSRCR